MWHRIEKNKRTVECFGFRNKFIGEINKGNIKYLGLIEEDEEVVGGS